MSRPAEARPSALERRVRELERRVEREQATVAALLEVGRALGSTTDLDQVLELILSRLTQLVDADRATLYLLDEAKGELLSRVVSGDEVRSIRLKVGHGIAGAVAQSGQPVRLQDVRQDPRFEPEWDALTGYTTRSMLCAPIRSPEGRTVGVVQALNKRHGGEFTEEDAALLVALGTQAAVVIDNSRLLFAAVMRNHQLVDATERMDRALKDSTLLLDLERKLARATTLDELVLEALRHVLDAGLGQGCALLLAEPDSGDLVVRVLDARDRDRLVTFGVKQGEGWMAHALQEGTPRVLAADAPHPAAEGRFGFELFPAVVVPFDPAPGARGALGAFGPTHARDLEQREALVSLIAANLATAVRLFRANQERERSERLSAIGRLLSQVIHDFKTPLTVVSGYVQLMEEEPDAAQRAAYAEEALKQFDVLTAMQREVLEFARGESRVFKRRVLLNKFFGELARTLSVELTDRPVELALEVDTRGVARFDEARVARALHNLARNAVEAMAERGGRLTLRARIEGGELVLEVADTGPGIPPEVEGRLFQSFVTAGKAGGTGLGLAIVKKIVDEHGGTIDVRSSPEGATFTLRLPQEGGSAADRPARRGRRGGPRPTP